MCFCCWQSSFTSCTSCSNPGSQMLCAVLSRCLFPSLFSCGVHVWEDHVRGKTRTGFRIPLGALHTVGPPHTLSFDSPFLQTSHAAGENPVTKHRRRFCVKGSCVWKPENIQDSYLWNTPEILYSSSFVKALCIRSRGQREKHSRRRNHLLY